MFTFLPYLIVYIRNTPTRRYEQNAAHSRVLYTTFVVATCCFGAPKCTGCNYTYGMKNNK